MKGDRHSPPQPDASPEDAVSKVRITAREIRELYERGVNIMEFVRNRKGILQNSTEAILLSYDLQSGSYSRAATEDAAYQQDQARYSGAIAEILDELNGDTVLEAGVGEATTLCDVCQQMRRQPSVTLGFDLSWSRIVCARKYASRFPSLNLELFTGDLFSIPLPDSSVDIVFTSHAVEPNHGREREALQELFRIARRWLVLFEPSYELGNEATKRNIERHGYVRNLPAIAKELGYRVARHELLKFTWTPHNQTALLLIEKEPGSAVDSRPQFACPDCKIPLQKIRGNYFCENCLKVFPVLDGIPCLLPGNGILASKFAEIA